MAGNTMTAATDHIKPNQTIFNQSQFCALPHVTGNGTFCIIKSTNYSLHNANENTV